MDPIPSRPHLTGGRPGRVVVTGGAGFLGSHLCTRLLEEGCEVVALDSFVTGSPSNLGHVLDHPRLRLVLTARTADVADDLAGAVFRWADVERVTPAVEGPPQADGAEQGALPEVDPRDLGPGEQPEDRGEEQRAGGDADEDGEDAQHPRQLVAQPDEVQDLA